MESQLFVNRHVIGRDRELSLLEENFARGGGVVLISGEPGIGKSRLLNELNAFAHDAGATILRGGSTESAGMPPYLPFLEAFGDLFRGMTTEELRTLTGDHAAALTPMLPDLIHRLDLSPDQQVLAVEQARLGLFEAVVAVLRAISAQHRTLIILDDLQWADTATVDLLLHVARRSTTTRLMIAGAFREREIDLNPAMQRGLTELNRLRILTTLRLRRLDSDNLTRLASRLLNGESTPALSDELYRQSEGNPFFAEELLRGWFADGTLVDSGDGWALSRTPTAVDSIIDAIRQRLSALPEATRDLLRAAAVIDRSFETSLLATTTGIDEESIERLLELPLKIGLLSISREGAYAFTHDKIRESLYDEVTPTRRRRLHGFIGRGLELQNLSDATTLSALAFHFANSGDRGRGAEYATQAMLAARASFALEEAIAFGESALSMTPDSDHNKGLLLESLADSYLISGRAEAATATFEAGGSWFLARNELLQAARMLRGKANSLWRREAIPESHDAFSSALALVAGVDRPEEIGILAELGTLTATSQLRSDEGIAMAQRALEGAVDIGRTDLEALASRTVGNLLVRVNRVEQGLPLLERALELALDQNDFVEATECCACLVIAHYWKGDGKGIRDSALKQIEYAERTRDLFQLRHVYCWLAAASVVQGDPAEAGRLLARQGEIVDQLGLPEPRAYLDTVSGMLLCWQGMVEEAEPLIRRGIDTYRKLNVSALIWHLGQHASALHLLNRTGEAEGVRDEIEELLKHCPPDSPVIPEALTTLVPLAIDGGDRERLLKYQTRLVPFSGRLANNLIDRVLGMIAAALGEWERAALLLAAAEWQAKDREFELERIRTVEQQALLAKLRPGKNRQEEARTLAEAAASAYEAAGFPILATNVRETFLSRSPLRSRLPMGLSLREVEVLAALASGMSNREIAGHLYISEKTVANHITSIFAKTGTENRVEAATFAIRNNLLEH